MSSPERTGVTLAAAVLIALALLVSISQLTRERIDQAQQALRLENLSAVLPPGEFDQNPVHSVRQHVAPELGGQELLDIYTAFTHGSPVAAVLEILAPDGYSGNIRILLGLLYSGVVVAARVIEHKETPGLGDGIEYRKSDWIAQFDGRSMTGDEPATWQLKNAGGDYDALTGATITSRAVLQAIHRAVQWYDSNRSQVFAQ